MQPEREEPIRTRAIPHWIVVLRATKFVIGIKAFQSPKSKVDALPLSTHIGNRQ